MNIQICLINAEKLKKFSQKKIEEVYVNMLSSEDADFSINNVSRLFALRRGHYHITFWVGGSPFSKGQKIAESTIANGQIDIVHHDL
jgi:hypothetical protein